MNVFDGVIVIISIVEAAFLSGGAGKAISAFRSIRIFRTFRVFRVTRLLRSLQFMKIIVGVIGRSLQNFLSIALLILIMLFIYALLGMQVLGGKLNVLVGRSNYDSFVNSMLASFQVMVTENWNNILQSVYASGVNTWIGSLYLMSWVVIGNWILLNLFLAIILDEFTNQDAMNDLKELEAELNDLDDEDDSQLYSHYMSSTGISSDLVSSTGFNKSKSMNPSKPNTKTLVDIYAGTGNSRDLYSEGTLDDLDEEKKNRNSKKKSIYEGIECEDSLFVLPKSNIIRRFCLRVITHSQFETVIMIGITLSSIKLAVETYFTDSNESVTYGFKIFDYVINVFFAIEMALKVVSLGLILDKGSYLRDEWNMLDGFIVVTSIIDMSVPSVNISFIRVR